MTTTRCHAGLCDCEHNSGAPAGFSQDTLHWSDLAAFRAAAGQGNSAWFNALPSYVSQSALYKYAGNPAGFVNGRSVFNCPTAHFNPSEINVTNNVAFSYGINFKGTNGLGSSHRFAIQSDDDPALFRLCGFLRRPGELQ